MEEEKERAGMNGCLEEVSEEDWLVGWEAVGSKQEARGLPFSLKEQPHHHRGLNSCLLRPSGQLLYIFPPVLGNLPRSPMTSLGLGLRAAEKAGSVPITPPCRVSLCVSLVLPGSQEELPPLPEMEKPGQAVNIWPWGICGL